jgi:hypothetical protein
VAKSLCSDLIPPQPSLLPNEEKGRGKTRGFGGGENNFIIKKTKTRPFGRVRSHGLDECILHLLVPRRTEKFARGRHPGLSENLTYSCGTALDSPPCLADHQLPPLRPGIRANGSPAIWDCGSILSNEPGLVKEARLVSSKRFHSSASFASGSITRTFKPCCAKIFTAARTSSGLAEGKSSSR